MRRIAFLTGILLALAQGGCTLVTNLDAYTKADGGVDAAADDAATDDAATDDGGADAGVVCSADATAPRDLVFHFEGFVPHVDQQVRVRVVSTTDPPALRSLAILDPLGAIDVTFEMPGAIPAGSHRLDFFADVDGSGGYTHPDSMSGFIDHSWQRDPCTPVFAFPHVAVFEELPDPIPVGPAPGSTAVIALTGMPDGGERFELRVIEEASGRTVGLYRKPSLAVQTFEVSIPGIIDTGLSYTVAFYSDTNGNQAYDPPPTDQSWKITGLTGGIDESFDATSATVEDISDLGF